MTIICPKKENNKITLYNFFLFAILIATFGIGVFIYNLNVNYRHEMTTQKNELRNIEVINSKLKSDFYELTTLNKMQQVAVDNNLVLEKSPQYMNKEQVALIR